MRSLQRCLAIALLACVVGAIYLMVRDADLPEVDRIDRVVKETKPVQEATGRGPFTTTIKDYVYTLTPRASYDIAGSVVSQHRGDALFSLDHAADLGKMKFSTESSPAPMAGPEPSPRRSRRTRRRTTT